MPAHIALLRGINVGGHNRLAMAELRRLFEQSGATDVLTYIQSGNVVFGADDAEAVAATVRRRLTDEHGIDSPVITRSGDAIATVVETNPFLSRGADERALHVLFLADEPVDEAVAALDPDRSPPDAFEVRGREIYLHCPGGFGKTKLTNAYFDARLHTVSTARNWRTTRKLLSMVME